MQYIRLGIFSVSLFCILAGSVVFATILNRSFVMPLFLVNKPLPLWEIHVFLISLAAIGFDYAKEKYLSKGCVFVVLGNLIIKGILDLLV